MTHMECPGWVEDVRSSMQEQYSFIASRSSTNAHGEEHEPKTNRDAPLVHSLKISETPPSTRYVLLDEQSHVSASTSLCLMTRKGAGPLYYLTRGYFSKEQKQATLTLINSCMHFSNPPPPRGEIYYYFSVSVSASAAGCWLCPLSLL